jgi:hypothetical protein
LAVAWLERGESTSFIKLNHAMHSAIVQIRHKGAGQDYYQRKLAEGKTKKEALRALKRRVSDAMYRHLVGDAA